MASVVAATADAPATAPPSGAASGRARVLEMLHTWRSGVGGRLRGWRRLLRSESAYLAEVAALCGLVFARPVLASFGESPETFIAWEVDGPQVLLFGLLVVLVPIVVVSLPAAVLALVGPRVRLAVHLAVLVLLGTLLVVQAFRIHTDLGTNVVWVSALVLAGAVTAARWRFEPVRLFLRYAGLASLVFLMQFLAFSPSASLVFGGRSVSVDPQVTAAVESAGGDDPPPVVVIMLDALPTATLMDGAGGIDAEMYPNLAGLAEDGTWYRNHTTVAQDTLHAVPAALSGELPDGSGAPPVASQYSHNLFTMLGGSYEMQVEEQVTALCPDSLCPDAMPGDVRDLAGAARNLWGDSLDKPLDSLGLPGAFGTRHDDFWRWIEERDLSPESEPSLYFYHLLMPHDPWNWLPGGQRYHGTMPANGQFAGRWGPFGREVGLQRHMLQTQVIDEMLGWFFDRLREEGLYDDALVAVTADHGYAFEPDAPVRGLAETQFDQIMWTPLIVKGPGQDGGEPDDSNVQNVDLLAILARELDLDLNEDLGWDSDGVVPGPGGRDGDDKEILDWEWGELHPPDGEDMIVMDGQEGFERVRRADMIEGSGPLAAWQRTEHGQLVGTEIADSDLGEPAEGALELHGLERFDHIDRAFPLPLEVDGLGWLPGDEVVAIALDGTVAAVVPSQPTDYGVSSVRALLWPGAFVDGHNEVTAYQVSGSVDDPTLHEMDVVAPAEVN